MINFGTCMSRILGAKSPRSSKYTERSSRLNNNPSVSIQSVLIAVDNFQIRDKSLFVTRGTKQNESCSTADTSHTLWAIFQGARSSSNGLSFPDRGPANWGSTGFTCVSSYGSSFIHWAINSAVVSGLDRGVWGLIVLFDSVEARTGLEGHSLTALRFPSTLQQTIMLFKRQRA